MKRETRTQWAERVRQWRASGLSASAFAARGKVNRRTLSWWAWKLGRARRAPAAFIEVSAPSAAPRDEGSVEIVLGDSVRVRVSGAFDAALLRRVVAALETR